MTERRTITRLHRKWVDKGGEWSLLRSPKDLTITEKIAFVHDCKESNRSVERSFFANGKEKSVSEAARWRRWYRSCLWRRL